MCRDWVEEGIDTIDMEASAVAAVAARYGRTSLALLAAWDKLDEGHTFLDPLPPPEQRALERANAATFEIALQIADEAAQG